MVNFYRYFIFLINSSNIKKQIPSCNTCSHYSNKKCFYYKVILGNYVVPLYDQIMEQDFANNITALNANIARNDERLCGVKGRYYEKCEL